MPGLAKSPARKALGAVTWRQIETPWLEPLFDLAAKITPTAKDVNLIGDPISVAPNAQGLYAVGNIASHVDHEFERYSYLLIMRSSGAILRSHGNEDFELRPGMIVELDSHRKHGLRQAKRRDVMAWLPYDSEWRISLDLAEECLRMKAAGEMAFSAPGTLFQCQLSGYKIVRNGSRLRIDASCGTTIAHFSSGFFEIHRSAETAHSGWDARARFMQKDPTPDTWPDFADRLKTWHGLDLPDRAKPLWLQKHA